MSVVIPTREVGFKGQRSAAAAAAAVFVNVPVYLHGGGGDGGKHGVVGKVVVEEEERESGVVSSESSSIGVAGESSLSVSSSSGENGGDGEEEVQSKLKTPLGSLESLEESLPIKRGLSNFFNGKSKSFASLSEAAAAATTASDLAKPENPFNKRRRILMSCKSSWKCRASYAALNSSSLPPLFPQPDVHSLEESEEEEEEEGGGGGSPRLAHLPLHERRLKAFRSPRSFSLSDLHQHA